MPRKLKTYQTSLGFFELAIAAPSMKAALEAWGSKSNLFHQGFAKEARDPAIIAATMAKPGVVLRRAVGSNDTFHENAESPRDLGVHAAKQDTTKTRPTEKEPRARKLNDKAAMAAAVAFEREERRRERERQKEVVTREKQRKQRERAIAKAETALEEARRTHETKIEEIEDARSALDRELQAEDARWQKQRAKLEAVLARARE
ncbi:MAG: cell envelope biogenesis protein TolA [Alphaproteobacteria bacterium]|nr:cell envelope biogenesis protein TolA [Acetobacteraceae bacterium]MBV9376124.1 cell envelope biogenesis protein TolA [Alphaproteobacteria bacterium]